MTVNRYATAAGKKFQRDVMKYLRDERGLDAENLVLTGAEDEGDVILKWTPRVPTQAPDRIARTVIECKREKGFHLASWVKQAEVERDNYGKHRYINLNSIGFVVVHYRRQHGIPKAYVTTTLDEWLRSQGL